MSRESEENLSNMQRYKEEVTSSKVKAIQALKDAGILLEDGSINPIYKRLLGE